MSYQESSDFCATCRRQVLTRRETANHLLHAALTLIFTCGLWLPIWIICALDAGPWRCTSCGSVVRVGRGNAIAVLIVLGLVGAMVVTSIFGVAGFSGARRSTAPTYAHAPAPEPVAAPEVQPRDPAPARTWTTRPAPGPRRRIVPGPTRTLWINADHGPDDHGNRASTVQPGAAVTLLDNQEQDGQAHVSSGGRVGWIAKAALEEVR